MAPLPLDVHLVLLVEEVVPCSEPGGLDFLASLVVETVAVCACQ